MIFHSSLHKQRLWNLLKRFQFDKKQHLMYYHINIILTLHIWRILFHRIPRIELAKPIILEKFSCVINCDPLVAWFCGSYKMHLCYLQNNRLWQNFENPFQLWQSFQKFFQQHHSWSFFFLFSLPFLSYSCLLTTSKRVVQ